MVAWRAIPEGVVWSTQFPEELLHGLASPLSIDLCNQLFSAQELFKKCQLQCREEFNNPLSVMDRKLRNKLSRRNDKDDYLAFEDLSLTLADLPVCVGERNLAWSEVTRIYDKLTTAFDGELRAARENLWAIARQDTFQHALLELSPDFQEFVRDVAGRVDLSKRPSQVRQRENTLTSYILRFCMKTAVCGSSGASSRFRIVEDSTATVECTVGERQRKAYVSHRCVRDMWDAFLRNPVAYTHIPYQINPFVKLECGELKTLVYGNQTNSAHGGPKYEQKGLTSCEQSAFELLAAMKGGRLIDASKDVDWSLFVADGWVVPMYYPVPGDNDVLKSLRAHCRTWPETNQLILQEFVRNLDALESCRQRFESSILEERRLALFQAEQIYENVTGESARRRNASYYADKFILFLEEFDGKEIQIERRTFQSAVDAFGVGLLLLAPQWFYAWARFQAFERLKSIGNSDTPPSEWLSNLLALMTEQVSDDDKAALSQDELFVEDVRAIQELLKLREVYFRTWDRADVEELTLSRDDSALQAYIAKVDSFQTRRKGGPIPLFSSALVFQRAQRAEKREDIWVWDSAVLGNSMNLSILGEMSLDFSTQVTQTVTALEAMLCRSAESILAVQLARRQDNKFVPWVWPMDTLILSSWGAPNCARALDLKSWRQRYQDDGYLLPPGTLRLSHKLILQGSVRYSPRVTMANVVLQRRAWFVDTATFSSVLSSERGLRRFVAWRTLWRDMGWPEEVFVESPGHEKAIYIDARSYLCLEVLEQFLKEERTFKVCEALPRRGQDNLGVTLDDGQRKAVMAYVYAVFDCVRVE